MPDDPQPVTSRHAERGATAIEFSIVFSALFAIFWAILSYAMPMLLYQVMNHATAETARFSLRIDPAQSDALIIALAKTNLEQQIGMLPPRFRRTDTLIRSVSVQTIDGFRTLMVTLTYPGCSVSHQTACVTPALNLIGISIPNLAAFSVTSRLRMES